MTELVKILNNPEEHYPGNFDTPQRANALLTGLCQDAATELAQMQAEVERLNRVNAELVAVLREAAEALEIASCGGGVNLHLFARDARAALVKATGETK